MKRKPNLAQLGWLTIRLALYCYGMYLAYLCNGDRRYYTYI